MKIELALPEDDRPIWSEYVQRACRQHALMIAREIESEIKSLLAQGIPLGQLCLEYKQGGLRPRVVIVPPEEKPE